LREGNCAEQQQRNGERDGFPQIHKFLPGVPRYKKKAKNQKSALPWRAVNWRARCEAGKSGRFLHQVLIRNQAKLLRRTALIKA